MTGEPEPSSETAAEKRIYHFMLDPFPFLTEQVKVLRRLHEALDWREVKCEIW